MIILAADQLDLLDDRTTAGRALIATSGVTELAGSLPLPAAQDGNVRPRNESGHEHFGFRDGISQPSVAGLVHSSRGAPHAQGCAYPQGLSP